jgi:cAMP phosphodiesterase
VRGGLDESNLSAYLVAPTGSAAYACLDAGTLRTGIEKALASKVLTGASPDAVLQQQVKAYLLSHAHLDHVAGLLLSAPDDTPKPIYALGNCLQTLQNDYFNWRAWPNFGNGGTAPLGKYQLLPLAPGQTLGLVGTMMQAQAFPLSHGPGYESAAFLLQSGGSYLLYLGDTGADELEHSQHLRELWQAVAPLVRAGQLRGIFLEASYPNEQPETQLFGHLTPRRLWQELGTLGQLAGPEALRRVPLIITHRKPPASQEATIARQLAAGNTLGMKLVYPVQGQRLAL